MNKPGFSGSTFELAKSQPNLSTLLNQPIKIAPPLVPQPANKQSALLAQLNSTSKVIISDPLGNIIIPLEDKNLLQAMASTGPSGTSAGKTATKMAMDHQATLDKGLKMKIKRTKPGTKTSEAKHEIVKAELNGTAGALIDDTNPAPAGNKKHSQVTTASPAVAATTAMPATPTTTPTTAQGTKRGSSGHRREKTREKSIHSSSSSQRDKNEHNSVNSTSCQCATHELQVNGVQTPCSSLNCIKNRTTDSNSQRNQTNNLNNSNSAAPSSTNNLFSSNNCNSSTNSSTGSTANTPGPPNLSSASSTSATTTTTTTTTSSTKNLAATISNLTQQQQQNLNQTNSVNSIKSQSTGTVIGTTSGSSSSSSSSIISSSSSSSSNSSTSSIIDDKRGTSPPPAKKMKTEPKETNDMCVGTSVGTITEPDCLGPCEPGTAVTLEGIVWHETEGGVLVVNVTWRGKTYVGTLLDCTRHDWAPPRYLLLY